MSTIVAHPDMRSSTQKKADEEIADYCERYLLIDVTTRWAVGGIEDIRRELVESTSGAESNCLPCQRLALPFVWDGLPYQIERASYRDGVADVKLLPANPELEAQMRNRIEADLHHMLTYYQGFGFACFVEDHSRYKDFVSSNG